MRNLLVSGPICRGMDKSRFSTARRWTLKFIALAACHAGANWQKHTIDAGRESDQPAATAFFRSPLIRITSILFTAFINYGAAGLAECIMCLCFCFCRAASLALESSAAADADPSSLELSFFPIDWRARSRESYFIHAQSLLTRGKVRFEGVYITQTDLWAPKVCWNCSQIREQQREKVRNLDR